jgi:hypothetical protein
MTKNIIHGASLAHVHTRRQLKVPVKLQNGLREINNHPVKINWDIKYGKQIGK